LSYDLFLGDGGARPRQDAVLHLAGDESREVGFANLDRVAKQLACTPVANAAVENVQTQVPQILAPEAQADFCLI